MDSQLDQINRLKSIYFPSEVRVDTELFLPLAEKSSTIDCMVGYFTSQFLAELAFSIETFLKKHEKRKLRFVISPHFEPDDLNAIIRAHEQGESLFNYIFPDIDLSSDDLKSKSQEALAYLVYKKKIELKIALRTRGIFHTKCWLFEIDGNDACVHGSSNATKGGLFNNFEQLVLSRAWLSDESYEVCKELRVKFERIWIGQEKDINTVELNEKTLNDIKTRVENCRNGSKSKGLHEIFSELNSYNIQVQESMKTFYKRLIVPAFIDIDRGDFKHQGEAIRAWESASHRGILSIATGGGKTYTSLVAAARMQESIQKLLVVIAVPTKTLMNQWEDDVKQFNIFPLNTIGQPLTKIKSEFNDLIRRLRFNSSGTEVVIITHNLLASGGLSSIFDKASNVAEVLLIADEVHNLGSEASQKGISEIFNHRIGLSATHVRQFDEGGTEFLLNYFGDVVYYFSLEQAIGNCLVPYNYYPHIVYLNADEQEKFEELTYEINKLSYAVNDSGDSPHKKRWETLCRKRRILIESCEAKISELNVILRRIDGKLSRALIFCTDKNPKQLEKANGLLHEYGIKFHQVTQAETSNPKLLNRTLNLFADGSLQVLTSKRVLDEGFNVPQTETAFLLASNTVYRQWIQRLGRILRKSDKTGKEIASLHDFVVFPIPSGSDDLVDKELSALLKSELKRVSYFSELSQNYSDPNGGSRAINKILKITGAL